VNSATAAQGAKQFFAERIRTSMTTNDTGVSALFLEFSQNKLLQQYWPRLEGCVAPLTDQELWWRPNESSNSIGNLILHLNGNLRQWLVSSFNHQEDHRDRPAEFDSAKQPSATELLKMLGATIREAATVLARLTEKDLLETYRIQGRTVTGLYAVYMVVEHFGMHYGQILYAVKTLRGEDLGFYSELSKAGHAD
jgi:uncharacterized damage-inducible protein DinB